MIMTILKTRQCLLHSDTSELALIHTSRSSRFQIDPERQSRSGSGANQQHGTTRPALGSDPLISCLWSMILVFTASFVSSMHSCSCVHLRRNCPVHTYMHAFHWQNWAGAMWHGSDVHCLVVAADRTLRLHLFYFLTRHQRRNGSLSAGLVTACRLPDVTPPGGRFGSAATNYSYSYGLRSSITGTGRGHNPACRRRVASGHIHRVLSSPGGTLLRFIWPLANGFVSATVSGWPSQILEARRVAGGRTCPLGWNFQTLVSNNERGNCLAGLCYEYSRDV